MHIFLSRIIDNKILPYIIKKYPILGCRQVVRQRFLVPPFRRFESFHPRFLKDLSNDKSFLVLFFTHFYLRHLLQLFFTVSISSGFALCNSKVSTNNIPLSIISFPFLFIQNKLKKRGFLN